MAREAEEQKGMALPGLIDNTEPSVAHQEELRSGLQGTSVGLSSERLDVVAGSCKCFDSPTQLLNVEKADIFRYEHAFLERQTTKSWSAEFSESPNSDLKASLHKTSLVDCNRTRRAYRSIMYFWHPRAASLAQCPRPKHYRSLVVHSIQLRTSCQRR